MSVAQERYVKVGGFRTRFLEAGSTNDTPVLLVHDGAFGASADVSWDAVIAALADDFHVIAPDLLGFGGTDKAVFLDRSPYAFRVPHIAALCEHLGANDGVHVVGTSFGGSVALRALEDSTLPWRLSSVTSISGTGGPWRKPEGIAALAAFEGATEDIDNIARLLVDHEWDGFGHHVERRYRNCLVPGHYEVMSAPRLSNPAKQAPRPEDPYPETLRDCDVPVLLVQGQRDELIEDGWTDRLGAVLPTVATVTLDTKHSPNIDHPDLVLEVLKKWLFERTT